MGTKPQDDIWAVAHRIKRWRIRVVNHVGICMGCTPQRHEHTWVHGEDCDMVLLRQLCRAHDERVTAVRRDDFDD